MCIVQKKKTRLKETELKLFPSTLRCCTFSFYTHSGNKKHKLNKKKKFLKAVYKTFWWTNLYKNDLFIFFSFFILLNQKCWWLSIHRLYCMSKCSQPDIWISILEVCFFYFGWYTRDGSWWEIEMLAGLKL